MKTFLTVLAFLTIASANAQESKAPEYYSANFEISKIAPMCPPPRPGQMTCMSMGAIVTLKATIGCADTFLFADIKNVVDPRIIQSYISVASVVKKHPKSDVIRCSRAQVITKTITIGDGSMAAQVVNAVIEPLYTTF